MDIINIATGDRSNESIGRTQRGQTTNICPRLPARRSISVQTLCRFPFVTIISSKIQLAQCSKSRYKAFLIRVICVSIDYSNVFLALYLPNPYVFLKQLVPKLVSVDYENSIDYRVVIT